MGINEIRKKFLDFFSKEKHIIVPSCPIIASYDDPSLMFVNAGMNQFKDIIIGNRKPSSINVVNSQPCMRVSGKHNDLEDVGIDTYHHTMFEMLGNWSFGDYLKKRAIELSWKLITEVYGIKKDDLYITIFGGSKEYGLKADKESFDIWKKIVGEDRIFYGDKKDNFWEMGDTGPCGPCTEIHIDIRSKESKEKLKGIELVNQNHSGLIELWNLVFIEYNRTIDGKLNLLPTKIVDTGMGLERLATVLQGKKSTYDIKEFRHIISEVEKISSKKYGNDDKVDIAMRVCADHIRTICFCVPYGNIPSNDGPGYVIRRIIRRAIRYAYTFLGIREPFLHKLVKCVASQFERYNKEYNYDDVESYTFFRKKDYIEYVIKGEENSFLKTIDRGMFMLDEVIRGHKENDLIDGKKIFELYDTYGFPLDLTSLILKENGLKLDYEGFDAMMKEQRNRSKSKVKGTIWNILDSDSKGEFIGYDGLETIGAKIIRKANVINTEQKLVKLVFDKTPFYGESGGQVGDRGKIIFPEINQEMEVIDTKKENGMIVHIVEDVKNIIENNIDKKVNLYVNKKIRHLTSINHTATHLLNRSLSSHLGKHTDQKGSFVNENGLKFDFSHLAKITDEDINKIESDVNSQIREAINLEEFREKDYSQALEEGYLALFGDKYSEKVRCIKFGESKELCGGTHITNTAGIGVFKIIKEGSISSGVRRIEAITANKAYNFINNQLDDLREIREILKTKDVLTGVKKLMEENKKLKKDNESLKNSLLDLKVNGFKFPQDINLVVGKFELSIDSLNNYVFKLKNKCESEGKKLICVIYKKEKDLINYVVLTSLGIDKSIAEELHNFIKGELKESKGGGANGLFRGRGFLKEEFDYFDGAVRSKMTDIYNKMLKK